MSSSDSSSKERLKKIKSGALSRGFALARVSVSAGAKMASNMVGNFLADANEDEKSNRYKEMVFSQIQTLTRELGQLKGSLMKVGQMLSVYGEHFLPPEANALLKSLQNQSPPMEWQSIEKIIKKEFSSAALSGVEISPEPLACASLGQVHRARRKADGKWLAMKIQYPGVDQAVESDLKTLRSMLSFLKVLPKGPKYDEIFDEVRVMLHQELDYGLELQQTQEFYHHLRADSRYVVPEVFPELSSHRILTTSFEEGVAVDSLEVLSLSLERRNRIAISALDLYFRELFVLGAVQTDPHFGNYRIRLDPAGKLDQLILLDFGAVQKPPQRFLAAYYDLVKACQLRDDTQLLRAAQELGFIRPEDSALLRDSFASICHMVMEPFVPEKGVYSWGNSDLPRRLVKKGTEMAFHVKLRSPPREFVFLDRKVGGIFTFLSVLKAEIQGNQVLDPYLVGPYKTLI